MVELLHGFCWKLLLYPAVKEFWKSVKNWQSYDHEFRVQYTKICIAPYYCFGTQCSDYSRRPLVAIEIVFCWSFFWLMAVITRTNRTLLGRHCIHSTGAVHKSPGQATRIHCVHVPTTCRRGFERCWWVNTCSTSPQRVRDCSQVKALCTYNNRNQLHHSSRV